jgi:hypothetical protein
MDLIAHASAFLRPDVVTFVRITVSIGWYKDESNPLWTTQSLSNVWVQDNVSFNILDPSSRSERLMEKTGNI